MLPVVGFGWAHWDRALRLQGEAELGWVLGAWWALSAGTLWLNAALDRDEGEVLLGEAVEPPAGIERWAYAALLLSVLLALQATAIAAFAALVCAALAVAYSHPALAWKGHPVGGPAVNLVGYGLLSPLAGWSAVGVVPTPRTVGMWVVSGLGVLCCYFVAQAFQGEEDRARGYRTLVAVHGHRGALMAARTCLAGAYGVCVVYGLMGWLPRICLLAVPTWWAADDWLRRWTATIDGGDASWAAGFAKRLLLAGLVVVALVWGELRQAAAANQPVAGLGTVAGHPPDRPRLPPVALYLWELREGRAVVVPRR